MTTGPTVRPAAAPGAPRPAAPPAPQLPTAPSAAPATASPAISASAGITGAAAPPTPAGSYVVKPGDTLIKIGLDTGQNWRDIVRWNGIQNPNLIEVGQVLRVVPPGQDPGAAVTKPVQAAGRLESRPLEPRAGDSAAPMAPSPVQPATPASAAQAGLPAVTPAGTAPAGAPSAASRAGDDAIDWAWPASGTVATPFDEARGVKGLSILGKVGDPVLAAADGRVVYAGSGLRGYGNLVIVKHNNTFLTAYAHNQTLLVKEEQAVRRGQKIAEMGSSDADQVKLHFEIRRLGKPVDPARLLPAR